MDVLADMAEITVENAGGTLRCSVGSAPDDREIERLYLREDVEWEENRDREIRSELDGPVAVDTYETPTSAENVDQILKIADDAIRFAGPGDRSRHRRLRPRRLPLPRRHRVHLPRRLKSASEASAATPQTRRRPPSRR